MNKEEYDGNFGAVISTGSTLLDLTISGGRVHGGGLPGGILVEVFGPSGSGKTVLLSEIAGDVQRKGGDVIFQDPEARLDKQFAKIFGLELKEENYKRPNKVPEVFRAVRSWEPENPQTINGIFADSLAALSTTTEMDNEDGDKMGMRRAKEFSEELRKTCRIIKEKNYLMVCSNQVRINMDAGPYGQKYITPGGESVGFYSSLRLRALKPEKIKIKRKIANREETRVIGVEVTIEVFKSSIWKPFHTAPVTILFDYGIDDVRANLQFIKDYSKHSVYTLGGEGLDKSLNEAIKIIEDDHLEEQLKEEVIDLWEAIEKEFKTERKSKR
jgi:protein RecA